MFKYAELQSNYMQKGNKTYDGVIRDYSTIEIILIITNALITKITIRWC